MATNKEILAEHILRLKVFCCQLADEREEAVKDIIEYAKDITKLTADLKAARQELLERGRHTKACTDRAFENMRDGRESGCICGWEKRRAELEKQMKAGD